MYIFLLWGSFFFFSFVEKEENDAFTTPDEKAIVPNILSPVKQTDIIEELKASVIEEEKEVVSDLFARATAAESEDEIELGGIPRATPLQNSVLIFMMLAGGYIFLKNKKENIVVQNSKKNNLLK